MANAVGELITSKLAELVWDKATLLWRFKDDVDGLKRTMVKLQALMRHADRREGEDEGERREIMRVWMKDFKAAAYDIEDLLDEFEAIELIKQGQPKIKLFFSSYNPILLRFTIAHKMKKLMEALTNIEKEGHETLYLVPQYTPMWADEVATNQATIAPTSGDIDIIRMVGRDTEKEKIIKLLKSEADEVVSIIPIIGLGGMGKTTLAQSIFLDNRTKTFDLRVWVYVSKKFDLQRIGEIIISTVSRSTSMEPSERYISQKDGDLQSIIEILKTFLHNKKYLIVLDDLWEERLDNLEKLKQMLQYGGKGSKIILTTRMQHVVDKLDVGALASQGIIRPVRKSDQINLSILSYDDCWNVMRQIAFRQDDDLCGLEAIGRQIAKKCAGLPLLARSLGFLLSQHKYTVAWEDIRDKKILLDMKEDIQLQDPLERLMLSYYYMPLKFKLCFTYCAVFPKGFTIASDHLIQQWRALGYIQSIVEGKHCVNYLLGMSFLQISKTSQSAPEDAGDLIKVTMHDLVYDLATIILDQELIALNDLEEMTRSRHEKNYCRHMQCLNYQKHFIDRKEFPSKIRSLHFTECDRLQLQDKSFSKSKYLRVLDISGCSIQGKSAPSNISLPSSIHHLKMLRYLDASGLPITSLSKSLHKLRNMQTLILSNCALETLPDNIGSLLNLCYLDLSGNRRINKLPVSFGELSALWFLKLSACSKLNELPESIHKLECLRHLDMSGCCALQNLPNNFGSLPKLLFLNLSSCSKLAKLPDSINLKSLEHLNLSSCHQLQSLPKNFGNLDKLKFLDLSDCYKIQVLPESFCHLMHLKDLYLSDCHEMKELPECFGSLSRLHTLILTSCSKLQSFPESFGALSNLKHLNLSYCVRFEKFPSSFGNLELQFLDITSCRNLGDLPYSIGTMTSLKQFWFTQLPFKVTRKAAIISEFLKLRVSHTFNVHEKDDGTSNIVELQNLAVHGLMVEHLESVKRPEDAERANLRDNSEIRMLIFSWTHEGSMTEKKPDAEKGLLVLEKLIPPRTLEDLSLFGYPSRDFPSWMLDVFSYLPYLMVISLSDLKACDSLPPFGGMPNLRNIELSKIPNLRKIGKEFYGEEGTCKRLRIIDVRSLENLDEFWTTRSGDEDEEFLIPNLHALVIRDCPKLKFLPYPPKSLIWELHHSDDVLPKHGFGRLSSTTLPFRAYIKSGNFSAENWGRLQHLCTLEELYVLIHSRNSLSSLPEDTPSFSSLRKLELWHAYLEILPEWLGQLIALEELTLCMCVSLTSLPESIRNLTALKKLDIRLCPRLVKRCKGVDAHKISHIPEVIFDGTRFVPGQPIEGSDVVSE